MQLEITDEGPGLAAAERERVWRPYQRGGAGQQTAGSGIGLAVVHDVVTQHGGRAWVEDAPSGRGARFVVTLPALGGDASSIDEHDRTEHPADACAESAAQEPAAATSAAPASLSE